MVKKFTSKKVKQEVAVEPEVKTESELVRCLDCVRPGLNEDGSDHCKTCKGSGQVLSVV